MTFQKCFSNPQILGLEKKLQIIAELAEGLWIVVGGESLEQQILIQFVQLG